VRRLIITSGDPDGIGYEVTAKALFNLGPQKGYQFIVFKSQNPNDTRYLRLLKRKFSVHRAATLYEALKLPVSKSSDLIEIRSKDSAAHWVVVGALACKEGLGHALITAPLSKGLIRRSGFRDLGHTQILSRLSRTKNVFMSFLGCHFHVLLMTGHLPIKSVSRALTPNLIRSSLREALRLRCYLPREQRRLPVAVLGLNPHAGESGLIGNEERIIHRELRRMNLKKKDVIGPLVPDVAFLEENQKKYSLFLALYHDQGLIPFKMRHGFDGGAHFTAGLPFIRTSVDHGTAKDIYGKNKAKYGSMKDAITWAIRFDRAKRGGRK